MQSAVIGGADATMMRAEVKALDHMTAKASPIKIDRKSTHSPINEKGRLMATLYETSKSYRISR